MVSWWAWSNQVNSPVRCMHIWEARQAGYHCSKGYPGTRTGCPTTPYCVLCDLSHLPAVHVFGCVTGSIGWKNQLLRTEPKSFAKFIRTLAEDEILMSFDVVSLFTCIPTGLAVQVAHQRLESDLSLPERTDMSVDDIVGPLSLCLDATFLSFRGKVYL